MKQDNKINSYADYVKRITDYESQVKIMCNTARPHNVLIVSGDPGIGKSYRAEKILSSQINMKYTIIKSSVSPVQLYHTMWQHNDEIIILDDVNSILQDNKDGASLLKACTESKPVRILQWQKQNPMCIPVSKYKCKDNDSIEERMQAIVTDSGRKNLANAHDAGKTFPDMFYFTGAIIILTNKSLRSFDRVTEGAVSNRGTHMEISFSTAGAIEFIKNFGPTMTQYNGMTFDEDTLTHVIDFMTSDTAVKYYVQNGKIPTLRNLGKIAGLYQFGETLDESILEANTEFPYSR